MDGFKKVLLFVLIAGAAAHFGWAPSSKNSETKRTTASLPSDKKPPSLAAKSSAPKPAASAPTPGGPRAGLNNMTDTLYKFTRPGQSLKNLVDFLESSNQEPVTTHNANDVTGQMAIVRTKSPLKGTRYFHAQYFSDAEHGDGFVQHMSFEVQPGPTAMNDTVAALKNTFGLKQPETSREGYSLWKLEDGRILWVKKMDLEDLKDDPFNAYSSADVGTVRVAIEAEIH